MEIILYLSAAVFAIAFFILVVFLAKTLKSLQSTLDSVSKTLTGLESQMQGVSLETTQLLHKTNALAEDLQKKSENLNTVVDAVKDVGSSIQNFNTSVQKISHKVQHELENNQDKISQIVQWTNVAMEIRDKWKSKKKQTMSTDEPSYRQEEEPESDKVVKKRFLRSR
ncbi:DUF948 domain-containing protein [Peribacillus huizhouensis]|uniref:Uncharacterized protein YoxC n=1 Tax=Peribacillus huizhouensis TaxID=1501239 RepID=A0ABR6CMM9_9BACI|nr:DUF948 domain-containing protein [Peribacillus huizhouensis]MBA9026275.1 uncharacterized protein YoxC [Peribacillus huizhouensis]